MERLLAVLFLNQVVNVRNPDLRREAGVDRTTAGTGAIKFGTGVVGINDVFRLHTQALEIGVEQRSIRIDIQDTRNSDAELAAILHESAAFLVSLLPARPPFRGKRIGNVLR